jgi:hypothetical protein
VFDKPKLSMKEVPTKIINLVKLKKLSSRTKTPLGTLSPMQVDKVGYFIGLISAALGAKRENGDLLDV